MIEMKNFLSNKSEIQVLVFKLNNVFYGIPVDIFIKEIAMFDEANLKRTIESKENVFGSIILRDKFIPIIDLKARYSLEKNSSVQKSVVIIKDLKNDKEDLLALLIEDNLDIKTVNVENVEYRDNKRKEFYGYTKINIDDKNDFLVLVDASCYFKPDVEHIEPA